MFEDIKKDDEKVIMGDAGTVKDPFDEVDPTPQSASALSAGRMRPAAGQVMPQPAAGDAGAPIPVQPIGPPQPLTNLAQLEEWSTKRSRRGVRVIIVLLIAVAAAGVAAAYVFQLLRSPQPPATVDINEVSNDNVANSNSSDDENSGDTIVTPTPLPPETLIDADSDGLTNLEEEAIGTNPENPDTDGDSINDRDERHVHKTNPLSPDTDNDALTDSDELFIWATNPNNPDTDGDTYLDGTEVQNGYSPTGPGRLPTEETTIEQPPLPPQPQP